MTLMLPWILQTYYSVTAMEVDTDTAKRFIIATIIIVVINNNKQ